MKKIPFELEEMYKHAKRRIYRGGDYISTISTVIVSSVAISQSTMSSLTAQTGVSSFDNITQLTTDQITNLINAVNDQIAKESAQIADLTAQIANTENNIIKKPDGFQAKYDLAEYILNSTTTEYQRLSTLYGTTSDSINTNTQQLVTLSTLAAQKLSTLDGYKLIYSTVLSTYNATKDTLYPIGSPEYQSTFAGWSTIEGNAVSSISGYTIVKDTLTTKIGFADSQIMSLDTSLKAELGKFDNDMNTFYRKKRQEILAEVDEYRYAAREYNAFLGMITANMGLAKLGILDQIDNLSFQIQNALNTNNISSKQFLETQRTDLMNHQTRLQTHINALNPVETDFNILDQYFQDEKAYKETFINTRSSLTAIERYVLEFPMTKFDKQNDYKGLWDTMDTVVDSINKKISNRRDLLSSISLKVSPVKLDLTLDPLVRYNLPSFPQPYPFQYNYIPFQSRVPTTGVTSDYALLPPLDFTTGISLAAQITGAILTQTTTLARNDIITETFTAGRTATLTNTTALVSNVTTTAKPAATTSK